MIQGEYWIENGRPYLADGDVVEDGHEEIANDYVAHLYLSDLQDYAEELGIKVTRIKYTDSPGSHAQRLITEILQRLLEDEERSFNQKTAEQELINALNINRATYEALAGISASLYVQKYKGWIAIRGLNVELYGFDQQKAYSLLRGIRWILSDEGIQNEDINLTIYDHKTKRTINISLQDLEEGNLFKPKLPPQAASPPTAARKGKIFGRELWRGTSENAMSFDFKDFFIFESSLRDQLKVPQNPKHHPEGPVDRHTMMVRSSLKPALKALQDSQRNDPSGPLSNLDLNFSKEDINILRLGGMLHDIGKGEALNPETLSAYGHERPEFFEKAMRRLGPTWQNMYANANPQDKDDLWYIITHHMTPLADTGFLNKALKKEIFDDEGKVKPQRRFKLLLVLLLMDRMGRGGKPSPWTQAKSFAQTNFDDAQNALTRILTTSNTILKQKELANKPKLSNRPEHFAQELKNSGRNDFSIIKALKGKFPLLSSQEIANILSISLEEVENVIGR